MLRLAEVWGDRFVVRARQGDPADGPVRLRPSSRRGPLGRSQAAVDQRGGPLAAERPRTSRCCARPSPSWASRRRRSRWRSRNRTRSNPAAASSGSEAPHAYFHNRLAAIARDVGVAFAVDDFGEGYASLSRMAELPLTQIKVDRAILHHPLAAKELSAGDGHGPARQPRPPGGHRRGRRRRVTADPARDLRAADPARAGLHHAAAGPAGAGRAVPRDLRVHRRPGPRRTTRAGAP